MFKINPVKAFPPILNEIKVSDDHNYSFGFIPNSNLMYVECKGCYSYYYIKNNQVNKVKVKLPPVNGNITYSPNGKSYIEENFKTSYYLLGDDDYESTTVRTLSVRDRIGKLKWTQHTSKDISWCQFSNTGKWFWHIFEKNPMKLLTMRADIGGQKID